MLVSCVYAGLVNKMWRNIMYACRKWDLRELFACFNKASRFRSIIAVPIANGTPLWLLRRAGSLWRGVWSGVLGHQPWPPVGGRPATMHRYAQAQECFNDFTNQQIACKIREGMHPDRGPEPTHEQQWYTLPLRRARLARSTIIHSYSSVWRAFAWIWEPVSRMTFCHRWSAAAMLVSRMTFCNPWSAAAMQASISAFSTIFREPAPATAAFHLFFEQSCIPSQELLAKQRLFCSLASPNAKTWLQ